MGPGAGADLPRCRRWRCPAARTAAGTRLRDRRTRSALQDASFSRNSAFTCAAWPACASRPDRRRTAAACRCRHDTPPLGRRSPSTASTACASSAPVYQDLTQSAAADDGDQPRLASPLAAKTSLGVASGDGAFTRDAATAPEPSASYAAAAAMSEPVLVQSRSQFAQHQFAAKQPPRGQRPAAPGRQRRLE